MANEIKVREEKRDNGVYVCLDAFENGQASGKLEVSGTNQGYFIKSIEVSEGFDYRNTGMTLINGLKEHFKSPRVFAQTTNSNLNQFDQLLENAGFEVVIERIYVTRNIEKYISPYEIRFSYKTLDEAGHDIFLKVISETIILGPSRPLNRRNKPDFGQIFSGMLEYGGKEYAGKNWKLAYLGDEIAGMVMPQIEPHDSRKGGVLYICVLEKFHGKGYGKILHAKGLQDLAQMGVQNYEGSTDSINIPMLKIFEKNGCQRVKNVLRQYRLG